MKVKGESAQAGLHQEHQEGRSNDYWGITDFNVHNEEAEMMKKMFLGSKINQKGHYNREIWRMFKLARTAMKELKKGP